MVKTKQQKSKPKKTPHVKKQGKQANIVQFRAQLDALGLKIIEVTADGDLQISLKVMRRNMESIAVWWSSI